MTAHFKIALFHFALGVISNEY